MKVIIVGGVAGGASAAARLRRVAEDAEIILLERGEYVSYANCGLPYYVGDVIQDRQNLLVQTPEGLRDRFAIDVRVRQEAVAIDAAAHRLMIHDLTTDRHYEESYDKLILSPGAEPRRPDLPGLNLPRVFTLRTVPDTYRIRDYIDDRKPTQAVVIGGGFIGVEMAENLIERGIATTLVEFTDQCVASLDADMAAFLHLRMRQAGMNLIFGAGARSFREMDDGRMSVELNDGRKLEADFVVFAIGVTPDSRLAASAGIQLGVGNAIVVDEQMRTSDPDIFAVGDAVQVTHLVNGKPCLVPLAGPANKQGRVAADVIAGREAAFGTVQGAAVLKVFDLTAASVGLNEKQLRRENIAYGKTYIHPLDHAGYYPGATQLSFKLLFSVPEGKILGAQGVGKSGVDKRIDVLSTAQRLGATVFDLEKLELCYAPPYSSAKDPVNMLGFTAGAILRGDVRVFHHHDVAGIIESGGELLDVRTPDEYLIGSIDSARNIPLDELRGRLSELPRDCMINVFCQVGLRGYLACRLLTQHGFGDVRNLSGGFRLYTAVQQSANPEHPFTCTGEPTAADEGERAIACPTPPRAASAPRPVRTHSVDASGLQCPGPILRLAQEMRELEPGDRLVLTASDPGFVSDVRVWCERTGNILNDLRQSDGRIEATITRGEPAAEKTGGTNGGNDKALIVFSGDLDKAIASMIIANGAAAMGRKVTLFFTFWGLNILRRPKRVTTRKSLLERMFGWMMPRGSRRLGLSRMNMAGIGPHLIRSVMRGKNIASLEELIGDAQRQGVRLVACQMSMDVMGIKPEELIDGVEFGGVATFIGAAEQSDTSLFI